MFIFSCCSSFICSFILCCYFSISDKNVPESCNDSLQPESKRNHYVHLPYVQNHLECVFTEYVYITLLFELMRDPRYSIYSLLSNEVLDYLIYFTFKIMLSQTIFFQ